MTQPIAGPRPHLRTLLSALIGGVLRGPCGGAAERALVRLGHRFPRRLPARGVIAEQLMRRHAGADLVATLFNGARVSVPSTREGFHMYFTGRSFAEDEGLTRLLPRLLREGDVFFDVGANLGFYTLPAARACGPSGRVHAFEAQAALAGRLRKSVALNGYESRIVVRHAAVSDRHGGETVLYLAEDKDTLLGVPSLLRHEWLAQGSREIVPAVSIDGYVQEHRISRVNVAKFDIEGAEVMALRGMRLTLERAAPEALIVEVLPDALTFNSIGAGASLRPAPGAGKRAELLDLLRGYGYEPRPITEDGRLGPRYTPEQWNSISHTVNVAFILPGLKQSRVDAFARG
ncbi:MAG TPA: FkbM family methyltransferase [Pyrinomonadaceae bacterium]|nr:FkbM family methyltransferase [Pyrinomonadaceae bacterium]